MYITGSSSFSFFLFFFFPPRCTIDRVLRHRQRKKKMEREYSITRRPAQFPLLLHEENLRPRRQRRIFPPHFLDPVFTPYKTEGIRRDKFSTPAPFYPQSGAFRFFSLFSPLFPSPFFPPLRSTLAFFFPSAFSFSFFITYIPRDRYCTFAVLVNGALCMCMCVCVRAGAYCKVFLEYNYGS